MNNKMESPMIQAPLETESRNFVSGILDRITQDILNRIDEKELEEKGTEIQIISQEDLPILEQPVDENAVIDFPDLPPLVDAPESGLPQNPPDIMVIQCPLCPASFNSEITFDDHYYLTHESGIYQQMIEQKIEEKMEIKIKNPLVCKVCQQTFRNRTGLEQHFEETHTDYEELMVLDVYNGGGFPGFDILIKLDMIREAQNPAKTCVICCEDYAEFICPLEMRCCHGHLCHACLKRHIQTINRVQCPFCYKDYETLSEPLCFVEKTDDYDTSKWRDWWEKHVDIFF